MQDHQAADNLAALGNLTRLRLYRLLVRAGEPGLNVGELRSLLDVPASTLAHHLTSLVRAGAHRPGTAGTRDRFSRGLRSHERTDGLPDIRVLRRHRPREMRVRVAWSARPNETSPTP